MAPKKHNFLSLKKKTEILDKVKRGVSYKNICREYDIVKSTITKLKNNESKIRDFVSQCDSIPVKRKTLKKGDFPKMENDLYQWFLHLRNKNIQVTSDMLCQKAIIYNKKHNGDPEFVASSGWMTNFKNRHGIRFLTISGEKLSSNPELVEPFLVKLKDKIEEMDLSREHIYNADESGLFWKQLPKKTMVHAKEDTAPGLKVSKERVTIVACTNASGAHKIKPMVIGKSKKPRAFKNFYVPVEYRSSAKAWMTAGLFREWFHQIFVPQVKIYQTENNFESKALLLIDNAPSHPAESELVSECGKIVTMFIPPNCTALIQPMDQNVINVTKRLYKKSLASYFVAAEDVAVALKAINLRDCVNYLSEAWKNLKVPMIAACFNKILETTSCQQWQDVDGLPLSRLLEMEPDDVEEDLSELRVCLFLILYYIIYLPDRRKCIEIG